MIIRFTASNTVAMILFIPLLIAIGLILAFIVPLLAVIAAAAGIIFLAVYTFARIGLVKKQQIGSGGSKRDKRAMKALDVKDYKVR